MGAASDRIGSARVRGCSRSARVGAPSSAEYSKALNRAAALGTIGGGIYDAFIAQCASKVNASALYTWNAKHFMRQGPDVSAIVRRP